MATKKSPPRATKASAKSSPSKAAKTAKATKTTAAKPTRKTSPAKTKGDAVAAAVPKKTKAAAKSKVAPLASAALAIGSAAPAFSLPADDGSTVSLASLRGKSVVLYFYPKDDTPGCTKEACGFRDAAADFAAKNAIVLGVSKDSTASHARFKSKFGLNFTLLSDPTAETIAAYGSWGQKRFMGRTFDGILRTTVLIDADGKVKKLYPKVSPETHADEILGDL